MLRTRSLMAVMSSAALVVALAACAPTSPASVQTGSSAPAPAPKGDGVLTIGTLFPTTGAQSYLGPGQAAGVAAAVRDINAAGGVLGKPVVVLNRDSGDATTSTIEASIADLKAKGAEVLIGPSSSVLAERVLPLIVAAKLPMISPAATSVRLTSLQTSGYLYRTIASQALEGSVLAATMGKVRVAVVYLDDDTGKDIRATLTAGLAASGGRLVTAQPFETGTTDLAPIVQAVKTAAPDDVVVVSPFGAMAQNTALITQLSAVGLGGAKLWLTSENTADYSQALPAGTMTNVNGILEGAEAESAFRAKIEAVDPSVTNFLYSPEAYDATILAALAATVAKSDSGQAIASRLRDVSEGGIKCTDFSQCLAVLRTQSDIDYDGVSGPIAFDAHGDPGSAHFGIYRYDAGNRFARVGGAVGG